LKATDAGGQHRSRKSDGRRALQHCLFCLCFQVVWRVKRAGPKVERIDAMCGIINALVEEQRLRAALEGLSYGTDGGLDGTWLSKLPPLSSGARLIPLVGASGSIAGRRSTPLRSTARPLI